MSRHWPRSAASRSADPEEPVALGSARAGQRVAVMALVGLCLAFLATPIARFREASYTSADLAQLFPLTRVEPGHVPANSQLSDPPFQMQPWLALARAELGEGRLPLWNPYNACGQPLLANYQSALLSPFNLPFHAFGTKAGLLLSAFAKLLALALLTYFFLREIGVGQAGALLGATAFAFSGHNVVCLAYPHPGTLVVLPGGLLFAERAIRCFEQTSRAEGARVRRISGPLVGLALCFGVGALAGQPEPFFFAAVVVAAWCATRLLGLARDARRQRHDAGAAPRLLALGGRLLLAASLGTALAAVQILPFLEYLRESTALIGRVHSQNPFELGYVPLWMFPSLLGNPAEPGSPPILLGGFEELTGLYTGGLVLFLAGLSLPSLGRSRALRFFVALALVWLLWAHDVGGAARLGGKVPLLSLVPVNRSQPLWCFAVAVCAAVALDRWLGDAAARSPRRRLARALLVVAGAAVFLAAFLAGARWLSGLHAEDLAAATANGADFDELVPAHVLRISLWFATGVGALAALAVLRGARARLTAAALVVLAAFAQTGLEFRDYNPVVEERFVLPETAALAELQRIAGERTVAVLGGGALPVELNAVYRVAFLSGYDALAVLDFDQFSVHQFESSGNAHEPRFATETGLRTAGVELVLQRGAWLRVGTELAPRMLDAQARFTPLELLPGAAVAQTFAPLRAGLQAVMVYLSVHLAAADARADVRVEELVSGRVLARRVLSGRELLSESWAPGEVPGAFEPAGNVAGRELVLEFPAEPDSASRVYRVVLECAGGTSGTTFVAWCLASAPYERGTLAVDGEERPGPLLFDFSYSASAFERLARLQELTLYRYERSLTRYWSVGRCEPLPASGADRAGNRQVLARLRDPDFDPARSVLVSCDAAALPAELRSGADGDSGAPAEVLEEVPGRTRLRVRRDSPGWLVAARTFFPGWKARVDGEDAPLYRANLAFMAVPVPAGVSEVELAYEPRSVRYGLAVSLASALALGGIALARRRSE